MGTLNHLLVRVVTQEPSREQERRELRLGMPRAEVDNHPLALPSGYPLECLSHNLVMLALNEGRPLAFDKWHEIGLRCLDLLGLLQLIQQTK